MTNAWYIQDTRGYLDSGPSCSECGKCECENCTESTHGYVPRSRTPVPACQCEDCENLMVECIGLSYVYCNPENEPDGAEVREMSGSDADWRKMRMIAAFMAMEIDVMEQYTTLATERDDAEAAEVSNAP